MSLDILHCRIVEPKLANHTYEIARYPLLSKFQETGLPCVEERRIGKSCFKPEWYQEWETCWDKVYAGIPLAEEDIDQLTIIFPGEVEEKVLKFIDLAPEDGLERYFNYEALKEPFDFLYISW